MVQQWVTGCIINFMLLLTPFNSIYRYIVFVCLSLGVHVYVTQFFISTLLLN